MSELDADPEADDAELVPLGALIDAREEVQAEVARRWARDVVARAVRSLPSALDAERGVLGAMLRFADDVIPRVAATGLQAAHFARPGHATVYSAMRRIADRGAVVDLVTVVDELKTTQALDAVGGAAAVAQLETAAARAAAAAYARLVIGKAKQRAVIECAERMLAGAAAGAAPDEALDEADAAVAWARRAVVDDDDPRPRLDRTVLRQAALELADAGAGADGAPRDRQIFAPAVSLLGLQMPDVDWLIRGVLTRESVCGIGGEPKTTKTWAGIEQLITVAAGDRAFGEFPSQVPPSHVAGFFAEDGLPSIRNRLCSLLRGRQIDMVPVLERIHFASLQALDLNDDNDLAHLVACIRAIGHPIEVLFLDPLRDLHLGEETNEDLSRVARRLRALRSVLRCSVVVVHHMHKASKDVAGRSGGQRLRGGNALHGALDCGLYFTDLQGNAKTTWENKAHAEIKGGLSAGKFGLRLDVSDNAAGAAQVAGWAYSEASAAAEPSERGEDTQIAVLEALRVEHQIAQQHRRGADTPIGSVAVAARAGLSKQGALKHLRALRDQGLIQGANDGWRYTEDDSTD